LLVAEHMVQALALRLKAMHACPLTPLHIEGKQNAIADVPSRSFGSNPAWACVSNTDLLNLFNSCFPLPQQKSWMVYHPNCAVVTHVISALRMKPFALDDWRQLPTRGRCIGELVPLRQALGSGSVPTTGPILQASSMPHGICSPNANGVLRTRTTSPA
jgi:hypothetical protein